MTYPEKKAIYETLQFWFHHLAEKPAISKVAELNGLKSIDITRIIKEFEKKTSKSLSKVRLSQKDLVKQLDTVFSKWIRKRDCTMIGDFGRCITCGAMKHFNDLQAGHFMSRRFYATRWEEKNCGAQCVSCNMFNQGKQFEFGQAIDQKYGQGTAERLRVQSRNKFDKSLIPLLIQKYKK